MPLTKLIDLLTIIFITSSKTTGIVWLKLVKVCLLLCGLCLNRGVCLFVSLYLLALLIHSCFGYYCNYYPLHDDNFIEVQFSESTPAGNAAIKMHQALICTVQGLQNYFIDYLQLANLALDPCAYSLLLSTLFNYDPYFNYIFIIYVIISG